MRRNLLPINLVASVFVSFVIAEARAVSVEWSSSVNDPASGILNANLIPSSGSVTYSNILGEGFDLTVTTSNLSGCGAGLPGYVPGSSWWFEGNTSKTSTVTFRFFQTGTLNPIGVKGLDFTLQDIEIGEPLENFGYWNSNGTTLQTLTGDSSMFIYTPGQTVTSDAYEIETAGQYQSGGQAGKMLEADLAGTAISGITFTPFRTSSGAGSMEMMNLGALQLAEPAQVPDSGPGATVFGLTIAGLFWISRRVASPEPSASLPSAPLSV